MGHKQGTGLALLAIAMFVLPACATKGYVNQQVGGVNGKVESLTKTVEETQERTKANEGKINIVDQKAGAAQGAADAARKAAADADTKAGVADAKAVAVDQASRKLVYTVTVSADQADFAVGKWQLPDAAKARIDELVARVKADGQNVYFEIEGHTDATGPKDFNDKLGLERAEAAMKYLHDQHQIPLHKISVISYGAEKPVAPNKTRAERAQNRRIVINVLS
jgi:outer membrane protein OmpA-like peptidoglycan-associated protein